MSPVIIFRLNTLKGTAPAVDHFKMNPLKDNKTALLTPKRYDELSRPFWMGVIPEGIKRGHTEVNKQVQPTIYHLRYLGTLRKC